MTELKSEVNIRAMEPEDLDMLYQVENDMNLWNVGSTNVPYSKYVLHDYIASSSGDIYTDKQVRLIVENAERDTVGIVDIVNFNPSHRRAEVGIVIMSKYRGMGYGKAALTQVLGYSLNVLHLHQLYAIVDRDNTESRKLFLSMGFSEKSELKDWLYDGHKYHDAVFLQFFL